MAQAAPQTCDHALIHCKEAQHNQHTHVPHVLLVLLDVLNNMRHFSYLAPHAASIDGSVVLAAAPFDAPIPTAAAAPALLLLAHPFLLLLPALLLCIFIGILGTASSQGPLIFALNF